jgi:lysophospholipase
VSADSDGDTGAFTGADGRLRTWRGWPAADPHAALIVVHGLGEHAGRYAEFAGRAAAAGISVFALDLAGHGLSEGRRGHVSSFDIHLLDIESLRELAVARTPRAAPVFVLGQSMGGLIALRYLQEYGGAVRGGVICSPWLATVAHVPLWKRLLAPPGARLAPAAPIPHGLDAEHLSRDPEAVAAYRSDALVQPYITPRTFAEVRAAVARVEREPGSFRLPLLFLMGDDDRIVDTDRARRFAQSIPGGDVRVVIRPGGFHELLHEPDRRETADEIIAWISTTLSG